MVDSNRRKLSDDDLMPWGAFTGDRLGNIKKWYWLELLNEPWFKDFPELVEYAKAHKD